MEALPTFRVVRRSPLARMTPAYLSLYWSKHVIYGLIEVDVTVPRLLIAQEKARTGEVLSFTGFLIGCLAQAVDEDKSVQGYLKGRRDLAVFDDVDVFVPVERRIDGVPVPIPLIIRAANRKSLSEIHAEIRAAQSGAQPEAVSPRLMQRLLTAPWPVPALVTRLMRALSRRDPRRLVRAAGTVGVTSLGMAGRVPAWGVAPGGQSLLLVVGGIATKPAVVEDRVEPRELLQLTVAFDHDVVDGAPAAHFTQRLSHLIESGHGLPR